MPVTTITIEADERASVTAMNNLTGAVDRLTQSFDKVGTKSKRVFDPMVKDHERARQSAQLLANTMGIQLPRALESVLSKAPGVSQALNAAFAATVIVTFAKEVLALVDNLTGYSEQMAKIQAQNDALIASVSAANKTLLGPQTLKQAQADILATTKYIADLEKRLGLTGGAWDAVTRGLAKYNQEQRNLVEELDKAKAHLNEEYDLTAKLTDEQNRTEPVAILKLQNQARLEGLGTIAKLIQGEQGETAAVRLEIKSRVTSQKLGDAEILANSAKAAADRIALERSITVQGSRAVDQALAASLAGELQIEAERNIKLAQITERERELNKGLADDDKNRIKLTKDVEAVQIEATNKVADLRLARLDELRDMETQTAIAILPPWQRADAQIVADAEKRIRQIRELMLKDKTFEEQGQREITLIWQQEMQQRVDNMANQLESVFDEITSGGIGKFFLNQFKHLVFQMVAQWIVGMNQMRGASAGAFGNGQKSVLSQIFGGLFGSGAGNNGGGPGGTPPFLGGLFGSSGSSGSGIEPFHSEALGQFSPFSGGATASGAIFGLGLSAGQGTGGPGGVLPSGSATGAAVSGLGASLAKIFPHGLSIGGAKISGTQLATLGIGLGLNGILSRAQGGGALGVLEGAAGGALTGFAFGGPIGAVIGGAIGLIGSIVAGLFGEHKGDKARKQVMEPLIQQIKLIKDSYDVFQTDYNSGVSELEQLRSSSLATLKSIGGRQVGGNSKAVGVMVDSAEAYLKMTEAERARRGQLNFGPAQFHQGGVVRGGMAAIAGVPAFHMGGEVNANLLIGEGVVNQRGMSRLGEAGLKRINAGGPMGDRHLHVHTIDTKSFDEWLHDGGLRVIVDAWDDAEAHGGV